MNNKQNATFDRESCPKTILIKKYKSNSVNKDLDTQICCAILFL